MLHLDIELNSRSISKAIEELQKYNKNLTAKCELFVSKLAKEGIETGKLNCGEYGNLIFFGKTVKRTDTGAEGKLIAIGTPMARLRGGETIFADPLLLAEFGSGWNAKVLDPVDGVGQGTFPGQTHAFDPQGWWYTDFETGESVHTYGESPTFPMHSAMIAMVYAIQDVAREVFSNG